MSARVRVATDEGGAIAVKTARSAAEVTALRYEADLLRLTGHPGLVSIVGHDDAELRLRYAGEPLERWRGDVTQAAGLTAAVAATVGDLHELDIVHGRLDGTHVLVGADGRPRLCGFAPPRGRGPADDVAALGRIMGELLDRAVSSDPRWPLLWRRGAVADRRALADVLRRATDPVPARRPSARALAAALLAAVPGADLPGPASRSPQPDLHRIAGHISTERLDDRTEPTELHPHAEPPDPGHDPFVPIHRGDDPIEPSRLADDDDRAELGRPVDHERPPEPHHAWNLGLPYESTETEGRAYGPADPSSWSYDDTPGDHGDDPAEPDGHDHGPADQTLERPAERPRFEAEVPIPLPRQAPETGEVRCVDPIFGDQTAARLDDMFANRPWPAASGDGRRQRGPAERRPSELRPAERRPAVSRTTRRRRPARAHRSLRGVTATVVFVGVGAVVGGAVLLYAGKPGAPPRQALAASACGAAPSGSPADMVVDIDGDGCDDEVQIDGGVVQVAGQRWQVGGADDSVAVADWDCDGNATPAIYRPATGEVFVFPRWAGRDGPLTVEPAGIVAGGDRLATITQTADGTCPALAVEMPTGEQRAVEVTR